MYEYLPCSTICTIRNCLHSHLRDNNVTNKMIIIGGDMKEYNIKNENR